MIHTGKGPKTAILHKERPLLQYLVVRVLDGGKVVEQARLGFMDSSPTEGTIAGRLSSMSLQIPAGTTRTVLAWLETQLAELDAYFRTPKLNSANEAVIRRDLMPAMHRSMRILTDTVDDFGDFFSARRPPKRL